jgi:hypothetical protein
MSLLAGAARVLYLLALSVWLGTVVFMSLVVAPTLFLSLPVEEAGRAVSALFPIYYRVGAGSGVVLLLTALTLRRVTRRSPWTLVSVLAATMLTATVYAGLVVQPRAQALRLQLHQVDVPDRVKAEFDDLHHRAVQLNGAVLVGGLAIAVITGVTLRP